MAKMLRRLALLFTACLCVHGGSIRKKNCQGPCKAESSNKNDHMNMEIPIHDNKTIMLNLQKSDVVNASLPVYLGTGPYAFTQWGGGKEEDFVVYEDPEGRASFVTWTNKDEEATVGMRGVFQDGDDTYYVEPVNHRQAFSNDPVSPSGGGDLLDEPVVLTLNNMKVNMAKVNRDMMASMEIEQRVTEINEDMAVQIKDFMQEASELGHAFPRYYYEAEVFLVVDYAIFDRWVRESRAYDYRSREEDAINNIRFYYAHVMSGITQRYYSVENERLTIRIRPVGIYIAKTTTASYWTESYYIKEAYRYTEAYKALDAFEDWINREDLKLPPFDLATLFTGNFLFNDYNSEGRRRTISGLADIQGVCGPKRASINREVGIYASIQTGAHEMGHNLGAFHDGYDNSCSSREQYIMATSPGQLNDQNRENPLQFSECSKNAFYEYLLYLNDRGTNCLLHRNNSAIWDYNPQLDTKPGERYSADEQCMQIYGSQSFYCGGGNNDENICTYMSCWDPVERKCKGNPEQRAAERTQCGDRKWCRDSRCEYDSRAPRADDPNCVYGDFQDTVLNQAKCYDIGINEPYRCYDEDFRSKCCATCSKTEKKTQPQCEFGDKNPSYCRDNIRNHDCYDPNTSELCCETCANFETGQEGCKYGDKLSTCRTMNQRGCYTQGEECCERCRTPPPGAPQGCEWGDKVSWCSSLPSRECMNSANRELCCDRCKSYGTGGGTSTSGQPCSGPDQSQYCAGSIIPHSGYCYDNDYRCCATCSAYFTGMGGCEYGDKYSWCQDYVRRERDVCSRNPSIRRDCCKSCAEYVNNESSPDNSCTDNASWCSSIFPGECYNPKTENTCCETCKRHLRGTSTCRYGDEVTWCRREYCDTSAERCCDTCR